MAFTSDPSTHRQCFEIDITDDLILEDTENFFLNLTLGANYTIPIVVFPDSAQVNIIDDDGNRNYNIIIIIVNHWSYNYSHYCWI